MITFLFLFAYQNICFSIGLGSR